MYRIIIKDKTGQFAQDYDYIAELDEIISKGLKSLEQDKITDIIISKIPGRY